MEVGCEFIFYHLSSRWRNWVWNQTQNGFGTVPWIQLNCKEKGFDLREGSGHLPLTTNFMALLQKEFRIAHMECMLSKAYLHVKVVKGRTWGMRACAWPSGGTCGNVNRASVQVCVCFWMDRPKRCMFVIHLCSGFLVSPCWIHSYNLCNFGFVLKCLILALPHKLRIYSQEEEESSNDLRKE